MRDDVVSRKGGRRKKMEILEKRLEGGGLDVLKIAGNDLAMEMEAMTTNLLNCFENRCAKLEAKLESLEKKSVQLAQACAFKIEKQDAESRLKIYEEQKEKETIQLWLNGFASSKSLSVIDIAYARFALSAAVYYQEKGWSESGQVFLYALQKSSASAQGAALLGMAHIAHTCTQTQRSLGLHMETIIDTLDSSESKVTDQACATLATLLLLPENRNLFAQYHGLSILIKKKKQVLNSEAWSWALANAVYENEANLKLAADLGAADILIEIMLTTDQGSDMLAAALALTNCVFNNCFAATLFLRARATSALVSCLDALDLIENASIIVASLQALANLSISDEFVNDEGRDAVLHHAVRCLRHGQNTEIIQAAACLAGAASFNSLAAKSRLAHLGIFDAFRKHLNQECFLLAVANILNARATHAHFFAVSSLFDTVIALGLKTPDINILRATAMIIAQLAPSKSARAKALADGRKLPFDALHIPALKALKKCRDWAIPVTSTHDLNKKHTNNNKKVLPAWLSLPITVLDLPSSQLDASAPSDELHQIVHPHDLVPQLTFFSHAAVHPPLDHIVQHSECLQHLASTLH